MDILSKSERSRQMGRVGSKGNRSTELALRMRLVRGRIRGWKLHAREVLGVPDFWFARKKVAVFVDGCFWHGCSNCLRMPKQNRAYWEAKIARNIARGRAVNRTLAQDGVGVVRIWEHEMRADVTLAEAIAKIERALERDDAA